MGLQAQQPRRRVQSFFDEADRLALTSWDTP
jgi:hypothetical protein